MLIKSADDKSKRLALLQDPQQSPKLETCQKLATTLSIANTATNTLEDFWHRGKADGGRTRARNTAITAM